MRIALAAASLAWLLAATFVPRATAQQVRDAPGYLARMDTDRDQRVSPAEYDAWMGYAFGAMDRNHDGVLSAAELPGGRGVPVTREAHRTRVAAAFSRQDRNHDGFLDARELVAPPR